VFIPGHKSQDATLVLHLREVNMSIKPPPDQDQEPGPFRAQVGPILFFTSIFFLNFLSRIILAPLMPTIEADLGIGHGEAGSLFLLSSIGYFSSLLGSGFFAARLTHRKMIVVSSVALGLALLGISASKGLWGVRIGLLLLGGAAGIYLPSAIATLTGLVSPRHWGKALAIHELAPNLSFVAAPLISEGLLAYFSWRGVLGLLGCGSLALALAFARFGRGGRFSGQEPGPGSFKALFGKPAFWFMMTFFALGIGASLGVYTMLPLFLIAERGMDRNWANMLLALSRISGLGMALVGGWASDRIGPFRTLTGVFLFSGILTFLLGTGPSSWLVVILFLQPMVSVCFFPAGFAALSSIGSPRARNLAVSLTIPFAFIIGGGVIPTGLGLAGDAGSFALGLAVLGCLIFAGAFLSRLIEHLEKRSMPNPDG
jgi:NNP family nitrate/nitrite transporter-like MFS transporter